MHPLRPSSGYASQIGHVVNELQSYTASDLGRGVGMPFHPGAEKYYRESGVM